VVDAIIQKPDIGADMLPVSPDLLEILVEVLLEIYVPFVAHNYVGVGYKRNIDLQ
jgi:hypothetical protein